MSGGDEEDIDKLMGSTGQVDEDDLLMANLDLAQFMPTTEELQDDDRNLELSLSDTLPTMQLKSPPVMVKAAIERQRKLQEQQQQVQSGAADDHHSSIDNKGGKVEGQGGVESTRHDTPSGSVVKTDKEPHSAAAEMSRQEKSSTEVKQAALLEKPKSSETPALNHDHDQRVLTKSTAPTRTGMEAPDKEENAPESQRHADKDEDHDEDELIAVTQAQLDQFAYDEDDDDDEDGEGGLGPGTTTTHARQSNEVKLEGSKPYQHPASVPQFTAGKTKLSLSQAKLFGLLDENGQMKTVTLSGAPPEGDALKKTLEHVKTLAQPRTIDVRDIDSTERLSQSETAQQQLRGMSKRSKDALHR